MRVGGDPVAGLQATDTGMQVLAGGREHRFDLIYSALGLQYRTSLADSLGAERHGSGALRIDEHNQTSVPGLYAAGNVARGLDQIAVALGHAAVAATHIHNRLGRA